MSQRNPLNDRYTSDNRKGSSRRSAASAKPASRAGASVHVASAPRKGATAKQRKAQERAKREKEREIAAVLEHKYYKPPYPKYRRARIAWAILLVLAAVCTFTTFLAQESWSAVALYTILGIAYACVIGVLILDFKFIRKMRKQYMREMSSEIEKDRRALEKAQKDAEYAAAKGKKVEPGYLYKVVDMPTRHTPLDAIKEALGIAKKDDVAQESTEGDDASDTSSSESKQKS